VLPGRVSSQPCATALTERNHDQAGGRAHSRAAPCGWSTARLHPGPENWLSAVTVTQGHCHGSSCSNPHLHVDQAVGAWQLLELEPSLTPFFSWPAGAEGGHMLALCEPAACSTSTPLLQLLPPQHPQHFEQPTKHTFLQRWAARSATTLDEFVQAAMSECMRYWTSSCWMCSTACIQTLQTWQRVAWNRRASGSGCGCRSE
jgi:hypothetical protein